MRREGDVLEWREGGIVVCVCRESEGSVREWMCEERSNNWRDGRRQREIHACSVRSERRYDKLLHFSHPPSPPARTFSPYNYSL